MDDLISRQAALNCFHAWIDKHGDVHEPDEIPEYEMIEALPPIQPMRKKGKWIYNSPVTMKCDQCEYVVRDWFVKQFRYCPSCGARMRGEKEIENNIQ